MNVSIFLEPPFTFDIFPMISTRLNLGFLKFYMPNFNTTTIFLKGYQLIKQHFLKHTYINKALTTHFLLQLVLHIKKIFIYFAAYLIDICQSLLSFDRFLIL